MRSKKNRLLHAGGSEHAMPRSSWSQFSNLVDGLGTGLEIQDSFPGPPEALGDRLNQLRTTSVPARRAGHSGGRFASGLGDRFQSGGLAAGVGDLFRHLIDGLVQEEDPSPDFQR